ncbi:MAG: DUF465 domain-containing protein [Robiginitomaculum sp.]|nr:DUF465 domain-containing protein [Robiginitomaculum sp.]
MSDEFEPDDEATKKAALLTTLENLKISHRRLDKEITALRENGAIDMINIARMKKQKLVLKDKISWLKNSITPDIIA